MFPTTGGYPSLVLVAANSTVLLPWTRSVASTENENATPGTSPGPAACGHPSQYVAAFISGMGTACHALPLKRYCRPTVVGEAGGVNVKLAVNASFACVTPARSTASSAN